MPEHCSLFFISRRFWRAAVLAFVLFAGTAAAQTAGKLTGAVTDKTSGDALIGVTVRVEGTGLGAVTDAKGEFFIINVPPGTFRVTASLVGYANTTLTEVRVKGGQTTRLTFELVESSLQIQDITVVADKPKVELDRTSSKETLSKEEISNAWGGGLTDVISDLQGTNLHGGIRGSFGADVAYSMDGLDLRDIGSNTNFSSVNLSTIQEVQVLTGGWNAEFGQANGAIVSVVSKKAKDRIHVIASSKLRPAGKYHWGRNFYGDDDPFMGVMTTPNFWNPDSTWQTRWMATPVRGYDGGSAYFKSLTPEQRAAWWKKFVNDPKRFPQMEYADRSETEHEVTVYGPVTGVHDLGFMLSARYKEGVQIYPSALKYNPDMTLQGTLDWGMTENTKFAINGLFTRFTNSGSPKTFYQSSETTAGDVTGQQLSIVKDPYSVYRYWMYGTKGGSDQFTIRPPEEAQLLNMQLKWTQVFSNSTFLETALQHSEMQYRLDFRDIAKSAQYAGAGFPLTTDTAAIGIVPPKSFWDPTYWGIPGDVWRSWVDSRSTTLKSDFTSQVTKNHLIKAGLLFSLQSFDNSTHEGGPSSGTPFAQVNDIIPIANNPYEGALYAQDKIEVGGMVINAGLRLDFFNANKNVSADFFDPLMISDTTVGHSGPIGLISYRPGGSGPGYRKTPLRAALSPRLGISHPITESTVLHFMFGIFNQRPAWDKLLANPVVWTNKLPAGINSELNLPDTTLVTYRYYGQKVGNPALTWEKMTQYEVGFEQNIADLMSLDVTVYYKDAYDLTSLGINQGPASNSLQSSGGSVDVRMYGDPRSPDGQVVGTNIRNFISSVNGAWADVRGLEVKLGTNFTFINATLNYNLSYLTTGRYHYNKMFKVFADGTQKQENVFSGANNTDDGGIGGNDQRWNPNNAAVLKLSVTSPDEFGFEVGGFYPLANWSISTSTRWSQGEEFTWYPGDYTGERIPNNKRWEDSWMTNLNINRNFTVLQNLRIKVFAQVTNLFNNKNLAYLTSATERTVYMEQGILPFHNTTKEPLEWSWYTGLPRIAVFGMTVEL